MNRSLTLLPKLATFDFERKDRDRLRAFYDQKASRTVRVLTHQHFVKRRLLEAFVTDVKREIAPYLI